METVRRNGYMKKRKIGISKWLIALILAAALLFGSVPAAYASGEPEQVTFAVSAVLPENQINETVSYFDLRMQPEEEQDLAVTVYNQGTKEIKVRAEAISASTNANGIIDYKTPDKKDETLKIPFSEIAEVKTPVLTIPAGGEKTAYIHVSMPRSLYDGTVLGGIVLTQEKEPEDAEETKQGVVIQNEYSYVVGVKLSETDVEVLPEFEPVEAVPGVENYHAAVTHYIRNREAAIAKDISLAIEVFRDGKQEVVKTSAATVDMAPNSVLPYPILWEEELQPGKYVSHVEMEMNGRTWEMDMPFEITAQAAQEIATGSVDTEPGLPWWGILLIVLVIVLIVILFLLLAAVKRKKRNDPDENTRVGRRK